MEPCSYLKSHVDFYMQGMLHAMAPWPAIKTRTVSDSWPIFHVGESLTRQYLVNNGRHIPHTLCEQLIAYRNVNKHLSMSIIFILTEELAAAKRLPYIPPSAARPSGSVKAKSASSGDGLKHKRQVHVSHLLDRLSGWWTQGAHKQGKPWKTNHLEVPKVDQNGGCWSPRTMANKINNIRLKWTCWKPTKGSSTRASRVSEAIGTLDAPRTMNICNRPGNLRQSLQKTKCGISPFFGC